MEVVFSQLKEPQVHVGDGIEGPTGQQYHFSLPVRIFCSHSSQPQSQVENVGARYQPPRRCPRPARLAGPHALIGPGAAEAAPQGRDGPALTRPARLRGERARGQAGGGGRAGPESGLGTGRRAPGSARVPPSPPRRPLGAPCSPVPEGGPRFLVAHRRRWRGPSDPAVRPGCPAARRRCVRPGTIPGERGAPLACAGSLQPVVLPEVLARFRHLHPGYLRSSVPRGR